MIRNGGEHEGKPFLSPEWFAKMLSPHPGSRCVKGGLFIRRSDATGQPAVLGHSGSSGTNCWLDFERDLIAILLTQTRASDLRGFRRETERLITACFQVK